MIPTQPRRILIVDDDGDTRDVVSEIFLLLGHDAVAVGSGAEALGAYPGLRPHGVVLDVSLGDMDGRDVARQLRSQPLPHAVTIVGFSGWCGLDDRRRAIAAGMDAYIVKPAGLREFRMMFGVSASAV